MELDDGDKLNRAMQRHPQARAQLTMWRRFAETATWTNILDVRTVFPSADGVPIRLGQKNVVITVFNIGGNNYRLLTFIHYRRQRIVVLDVLTHAEYSKGHWKNRY